jgi:hypothetical protein
MPGRNLHARSIYLVLDNELVSLFLGLPVGLISERTSNAQYTSALGLSDSYILHS